MPRLPRSLRPFSFDSARLRAIRPRLGRVVGGKSERGRVEAGLERELVTRHDIGHAERAALRAQARAIDRAEAEHEADTVTRANGVYLAMREAAGLSAAGAKPADDFERLLAAAMRPTPGTSDTAHD
jgi:hypothetical protein